MREAQWVPVQRSGQGSGLQSTARQIGSALGIAVLGTVLFAGLAGILSDRIADHSGLAPAQWEQVVTAVKESAGAAIAGWPRTRVPRRSPRRRRSPSPTPPGTRPSRRPGSCWSACSPACACPRPAPGPPAAAEPAQV